jgi:uncharacterized damage-inducible protein DinB
MDTSHRSGRALFHAGSYHAFTRLDLELIRQIRGDRLHDNTSFIGSFGRILGHVFDTDQEIISLLLMKVLNSRILSIVI